MGRKLRTGIRAAPKVQEREILRKARELRSHPEALVPRCLPETCPRCPFDSLLERLRKVAEVSDDEGRLERLASWGSPLARAYAATLLLGLQGKAPYLAPANTPFGTVHYAHRGKARRDELVGVQYYDVPELRLLTIADIARKKRLHVYSMEHEMVTTCREDRPPEQFVRESIARLQVDLQSGPRGHGCPHSQDEPCLVVEWHGAAMRMALCQRCTPSRLNVPALIASRMIVPRVQDCFSVYLRLNLQCHDPPCSVGEDIRLEGGNVESYLSGQMKEKELLVREFPKVLEERVQSLGLFVLGRECFEHDFEALIRQVGVPEELVHAFLSVQDELEGLLVSEPTVAKLVGALPEEQRLHVVAEITGDQELAEALLEAWKAEGKTPERLVAEALEYRRDLDMLARLPSWERLPKIAAFADSVARVYKLHGAERAAQVASKGLKGVGKQRLIALALLEALRSASGREWMFSKEEIQLVQFLRPMVQRLLASEGQEYAEALQELLTASGSGEVLPKL